MQRFEEKQGVGTICRDFLVNNGLVMRAVGDIIVVSAAVHCYRYEEADEIIADCVEMPGPDAGGDLRFIAIRGTLVTDKDTGDHAVLRDDLYGTTPEPTYAGATSFMRSQVHARPAKGLMLL